MKLEVNGKERVFEAPIPEDVGALLEILEVEGGQGVAVALNDQVVPRSRWGTTSLDDGDRVEIIRATQGG